MSRRDISRTSSSSRNGRFERTEYSDDGSDRQTGRRSPEDKRYRNEDTWKGIFVVTQFWVICSASVAFLVVVTATAAKLSDRQILETKDSVSQSHTWFKFAICLRPFMTSDLMKEMYAHRLNRSFYDHLASLDVTDEEKAMFMKDFYLDSTLQPMVYQNYFKYVHPWKDISPFLLWEFQNSTIRSAFEEFLLNTMPMGTTKNEETQGLPIGSRIGIERYTTLPPPRTLNATEDQPLLVGEYLLSPLYLGCLSMTVNQEMANKQMEISIKFRPTKTVLLHDETAANKSVETKTVKLFTGADVFVFNKNDSFTEIPTVKRNAKFSIMATSRERLLLKSSMYIRQRSKRRNCEITETHSEITCRQDCIYTELLNEINCTLPWMERFRHDLKLAEKYSSLPICTDLDEAIMFEAIAAQESFLCNIKIMEKKNVQGCLQNCLESCRSSLVRILSLGSKSIGSNYGVSLTVSPIIDVVKEHFSYNVANMVSELCASVSFLLGLSAIAIYDWLVAFGVWTAAKLGLHAPKEERKEREEAGRDNSPAAGQGGGPRSKSSAQPIQAGPRADRNILGESGTEEAVGK